MKVAHLLTLEELINKEQELLKSLEEVRDSIRYELDNLRCGYIDKLTSREREVLKLVRQRPVLVTKEIADRLNVAPRTIKYHLGSLMKKAAVRSRFEL